MMGESSADEVGGAAAPLRDVRSMRHGFSLWSAAQLSLASMRPLVGIAAAAYLISSGGLGSWLAVLLLLLVLLLQLAWALSVPRLLKLWAVTLAHSVTF